MTRFGRHILRILAGSALLGLTLVIASAILPAARAQSSNQNLVQQILDIAQNTLTGVNGLQATTDALVEDTGQSLASIQAAVGEIATDAGGPFDQVIRIKRSVNGTGSGTIRISCLSDRDYMYYVDVSSAGAEVKLREGGDVFSFRRTLFEPRTSTAGFEVFTHSSVQIEQGAMAFDFFSLEVDTFISDTTYALVTLRTAKDAAASCS